MFGNTLNGVVTDESKKPIEFSNILLHKYEDPSYLNGTTTDSLGKFEIQKIDDGKYFLEIVYIGYKPDTIQNIELRNEDAKNLGELQLNIEANTLKGVEISGNKPVIERRADRIIFNAENSTAGTGENLLDLLRRVPSVTVSGSDEIKVNGKSQVQVMINGKIETLTGDQLATMLKSIQSDNIKKIEVISNPSARFDASAKGGILDIQLKSYNKKSGVNGNIHSGYRQGKFGRTDNGFNLNVNYNKIIVSTTYNFGVENNYNTKEFIRNFHLENAIQQFREHTYDRGKFMFHYTNLSMKYNINDKHSIGIGGEFFTFRNPTTPLSIISIVSDTRIGKIDSSQFTNIHNLTKNINPSLNFNYRGNLDSAGSTLDITYDYTYFNLNTSSHLNTTFLDDSYTEYRAPVDFTQNNPFIVNLHTAKLDYYKPLKNKHTIDFGAKFSWTRTHNDIHFSNFIGDQYINDVTKSNEFIYIENTNALYSTWSKMWKKNWSTNVGMRIEQTNTDQHSVTLNTTIRKHYIDFFPSAFIQKTIKEKHVLNLNYSRKIHRPDFKDLNPFQFYNSSYSIFTGNPNLKPEYINVFEFTYSYDNTYSIVLGYENKINNYTYLAKQNDTTKIHTYQATNFKVRNNFNISVNINKEIFKWWSINIESRFMYFKYNSIVNDAEFKLHSLKFGMSMDNTFILPKDFKINLFAFYESPFLDATDWVLSNGMVNFAITKTFFQKQLKVKVGVNDIFSTLNNSYNTRFQNIDTRYKQKFTSRVINLSVSYNFSKGKQFKNTQINKSNSDEKGRIH
jgi:outer membrane receptor protein involved in Fe transport